MSAEDFLLRFEGLSDDQIAKAHLALRESPHTIANIQAIVSIIEHELPRLKRTLATVESVLASINATQERYR